MPHGVLDGRPGRRIAEPTEVASRERIVTRAFGEDIEADREFYGPCARKSLLESRKEFIQCALPAEQQRMGVSSLRRSRSMQRLRRESIALQNNDVTEMVGECACSRKAGHARADHNGLFPDRN